MASSAACSTDSIARSAARSAVDTRPPRAAPPVNLPELDKRIEALKDERANLQDAIAAATARRKFAERFAEASPAGIGDKGEARPIAEWRAAFAAVSEEVASAGTAVRDAERKQRDLDREIERLESDREIKPPDSGAALAAARCLPCPSYAGPKPSFDSTPWCPQSLRCRFAT